MLYANAVKVMYKTEKQNKNALLSMNVGRKQQI